MFTSSFRLRLKNGACLSSDYDQIKILILIAVIIIIVFINRECFGVLEEISSWNELPERVEHLFWAKRMRIIVNGKISFS